MSGEGFALAAGKTSTLARFIDFAIRGDERGSLVAIEETRTVPFVIKRVYYIYDTAPNVRRGQHAHLDLEQVLIPVSGQCRVLLDDGRTTEEVVLDRPDRGLYLPPDIWREMFDFSDGSVLLVLASKHYDEADYIRDYETFRSRSSGRPAEGSIPGERVTIHPLAEVQATAIGAGTRIWQYAVVLAGARVGANCNICAHTFIEGDVVVGDDVTIKSGVYLWDGLRVGNGVFIGPNATFTNDRMPRSKQRPPVYLTTRIEDGASIGANATILPGVTIGRGAMVGAGAVVVTDVPEGAVVVGNPARPVQREKKA